MRERLASGIRGSMRWSCLVSVALLTACGAAEVQSQKLNDGSYKISCELPMDDCIRRVQDQCKNQRFRILEGTSETRLRDVYPFEQAFHTSRLRLVCTNDGANPLLSFDKPREEPSLVRAPVCAPGETRACVGAGACKGGHACLSSGNGFGPCDCGPLASSPPPPPAVSAPANLATPPASDSGAQVDPALK